MVIPSINFVFFTLKEIQILLEGTIVKYDKLTTITGTSTVYYIMFSRGVQLSHRNILPPSRYN
jgi:hypothetical protein